MLAAVTCDHRPVPSDAGHRCACIAERLQRPLAAVLGDDIRADDRDQADEHEQSVARLAEQHRPGARREEQEHERLRGRLDDEPPHARPLRRLQLVGPDPGGAPRGLGGFEAGGRVDGQPVGNRRGRQGVRVGQRVRLGARGHVLMIGDRRQFATCRPARSGAGTGQRATMRNVTTPISSGAPSATPTGIHADRAAGTLTVDWADGHRTAYDARSLRWLCPCAFCRGEAGLPGWLDSAPTLTDEQTRLVDVQLVGSYAICPTWGDGHRTGYYSFAMLRARCPCPVCSAAAGGRRAQRAESTRPPPRRFDMIVVTTPFLAGNRVLESKGMVFGLVVRSRGLGGNVMAQLRSLGGGEIHEYTELLEDTRRQALDRLVQNATLMGANAILSMRFDSSELSGTMSEIVAYGTAVVVEPDAGAAQPSE